MAALRALARPRKRGRRTSISASREDCRSKKVDDIKAIPAKPTATKPTAMRADDALTVIQLATPAAIAATMNIQGATGE